MSSLEVGLKEPWYHKYSTSKYFLWCEFLAIMFQSSGKRVLREVDITGISHLVGLVPGRQLVYLEQWELEAQLYSLSTKVVMQSTY